MTKKRNTPRPGPWFDVLLDIATWAMKIFLALLAAYLFVEGIKEIYMRYQHPIPTRRIGQ